jgi:transcriptional regulator of acetoin/glycerol metabolism
MTVLQGHDWPGNIRELEHVLERAVLLGQDDTVGLEDLPPQLIGHGERALVVGQAVAQQLTLHDLEKEYIGKILENTRGNKTEAARILGVDRTTLYRKLEEYKIKE